MLKTEKQHVTDTLLTGYQHVTIMFTRADKASNDTLPHVTVNLLKHIYIMFL